MLHTILSGSGAWPRRLPHWLQRPARRLFGSGVIGQDVIQVPWAQVEGFDSVVHLRAEARELGLGKGDDRDATLFRRVPGA